MQKNDGTPMKKAYTFDDVALVPQFNNVPSRTEPSLDTWLTKDLKEKMPLVPSNMDSVIGDNLADLILKNGSFPIFHRFISLDEQIRWVKKYENKMFISAGMKEDSFKDVERLLDLGALGTCIDVAHGHSDRMIHLVEKIKNKYPGKQIIAGNVCT